MLRMDSRAHRARRAQRFSRLHRSWAAARSPLKTVHWTVFRALRTHRRRRDSRLRPAGRFVPVFPRVGEQRQNHACIEAVHRTRRPSRVLCVRGPAERYYGRMLCANRRDVFAAPTRPAVRPPRPAWIGWNVKKLRHPKKFQIDPGAVRKIPENRHGQGGDQLV